MQIRYLVAEEIENMEGFREPSKDPETMMFKTRLGELSLESLGNMGWTLITVDRERWIFRQEIS
jgi:hypothetical protein